MIRVKNIQTRVKKFLADCVSQFAMKHPDVRPSCFGLHCSGYSGYLVAFMDTSMHAQEKLREYDDWIEEEKRSPETIERMGEERFWRWIDRLESHGRDSIGRFNTSCHDFAYAVSDMWLPDWPKPYSKTDGEVGRWDFRWPDGHVTTADAEKGNVGIDREVLPILVECLEALDTSQLRTEDVFRIGVQMSDETFVRFWIPRLLQSKDYQPFDYSSTALES